MRNCQLKSGSKDKGTSAGKVFAESLAAVEHAAVVRDHGAVSPLTMEFLRARVRRKWQVSGPDPKPSLRRLRFGQMLHRDMHGHMAHAGRGT